MKESLAMWCRRPHSAVLVLLLLLNGLVAPVTSQETGAGTSAAVAVPGGPLPGPLPLFPPTNWWNLDISAAPVDPGSAAFISFIGPTRGLHPDLGGDVTPGSVDSYGMPYVVVDGTQPKRAVSFVYADESDGVDHATGQSFPFYPIPDEAITQAHWIEGGPPGNVDLRDSSDRHLILVDRDNKYLYELFNVFYDGTQWLAGSGAFFDMKTDNRRPDGWTSADAAGLAILPGLLRYDEVSGTAEINHAFRVTLRASNGYVWPASHAAGSNPSALPMGARLRLKASRDISGFTPEVQRIFRAMKTYGLIMADNGSDMYVTGTYDNNWDADVLNPAFSALKASDFEVVQLGYRGAPSSLAINDPRQAEGNTGSTLVALTVTLSPASTQTVTANYATADGTAIAGSDYTAKSGTITFAPGQTTRSIVVAVTGDSAVEPNETFSVTLSNPTGASLAKGTGTATVLNDDPAGPASIVNMYRLYADNLTYEHLYTTDLNEYTVLGAGYNGTTHVGWLQEGIAYHLLDSGGTYNGAFGIPLYRLYNTVTRQHHWTTDTNEVSVLSGQADWNYEGIVGYVVPEPTTAPGVTPLYRLWDTGALHLWTTDLNEKTVLSTERGWIFEGIIGNVIP
jgi:hypothetical protein